MEDGENILNGERGYRYHEHTADITIECWAPTLEEAFEEAAVAAFNVIVDISTVEPIDLTRVEVEGIDLPELLVEWIGQLIALIDLKGQFFSKFVVASLERSEPCRLTAEVWGEAIDYEKHDVNTEVKAMTYADLKIDETDTRTTIWFTLDL